MSRVTADTKASVLIETAAHAEVDERPQSRQFPVVGIGASAGGLEAFTNLLAQLPAQTGMAYVLVQHLDPTHESQLAGLLSKVTHLPVTEVTDGMAIVPDHVYVIPPNTNMAIVRGVLKLTPRGEAHNQHLPLDTFFRSLAADQQGRAIGVILSGTGSDGSLGLAEIKAVGGITFAQDAQSAKFPAMPLNAINAGCVDFVLPPEEIARELGRVARHDYLSPTPAAESDNGSDDFRKTLTVLRSATGVDFSHYRDTTIRRRISRRMAIHHKETLADYVQFLEENTPEADALYHDILINVTSFFRDPETFDALREIVLPGIVAGKSPETPIRIWVPGCSTGQEAYSLAITLLEFLDQKAIRPPIQIFGTDINDLASIEKARVGLYPHSIESEVSPERLRRFFTKEDGGYRVGKSIRDMCVFARQNVAADPPFSRLDLISCRNLLIYLGGPLQKRVIPTFHYALNPGGYLLLGAAETIGRFTDLFTPADKKHNIFRRTATVARTYPFFNAEANQARTPAVKVVAGERTVGIADMQREADRIVLGRFAPAGVLVNDELEVLQFRGRTGPYLEMPSGEASFSLLRMARDSLFLELRSATDEARKTDAPVRRRNVRIRDEHEVRRVNLEVIPIRPAGQAQRCLLVLFEEASAAAAPDVAVAPPAEVQPALPDQGEVAQLRRELTSAKEYLQAIIEQQNATNEELQSANEEVLSSNEELQSTNEEMQTAKEELQSTNEELHTVNEELRCRNHEVGQVNDDLTNTLGSVKIPIVMLGRDLRIRRFTPAAGTLLNLIPEDLGRPLIDIRQTLDVVDLEAMLLEVIATVAITKREVRSRDGRWYLLRLHPYRTADDRIDGVVMVLHDIDEEKRIKEQLAHASEVKDYFMAVLSHELRTPLTPVLATVAMLQKDGRFDADTHEQLEVIRRNTELEVRLIDDLLDVTRISRGKVAMDMHPVELGVIIQRAVEVCQADIEARKLKFSVDAAASFVVDADAARLQQVFWNLLRNSIKFTPAGGSVSIRCRRDGKDHVLVEVIDTGIGIEADVLPRLFNAFEQAEMSITRRFGGLGLGLNISKVMVEMHGGTISAHSDGRNRGATFRVSLPLLAAGVAPAPPTPQDQPECVRPLRILLVEDHGDTARIMQRLLSADGHKVETAADVTSALKLAGGQTFDLLLSDLGLPDGTGLDLMRALRAQGSTLPGIALSGYGQEQDIVQSRGAGFAAHLVKPVDLPQLEKVMAAISGGSARK